MDTSAASLTGLEFTPAAAADAEALVALRIAAMRESLERIGRFDPQRARDRFLSTFTPEQTQHLVLQGERVGFVVVRSYQGELQLDHLYVHPAHQGRGIGAAVLARVFAQADTQRLPVRVGALRGSDSNRFYQRHGFRPVEEGEWDIHYVRPCVHPPASATAGATAGPTASPSDSPSASTASPSADPTASACADMAAVPPGIATPAHRADT